MKSIPLINRISVYQTFHKPPGGILFSVFLRKKRKTGSLYALQTARLGQGCGYFSSWFALYRNVTACARVQVAFGLKVSLPVPEVTPLA